MMIYYLIFSAIFISVFSKQKKLFLLLNFFITGLLVVLRDNVGNDFSAYSNIFNEIKEGGGYYFEIGYTILNIISPNFFIVIILTTIISFFFLYKSIMYFNKENPNLSLFIYFAYFLILFNFHLIRQGVAIAIVLYSYKYIYERSFFKFLLFIIFASFFHKTALIMIPFYYFTNLKLSNKSKYIILIGCFISTLISPYLVEHLRTFLMLFEYTSRYAEVYFSKHYILNYGLSLGLIFDYLMFFYLLYLHKNSEKSKEENFILNILFLSLGFNTVLSSFSVMMRLGYYLRVFNIFAFSLAYKKTKYKKFFISIILIVCFAYLYKSLNYTATDMTYEIINIFKT